MAAPKGSKKYHNPQTGEVVIRMEHPGEPWVKGIPDSHKNAKDQLVWHDPETGEHIRRSEHPGYPWVRGWHPDRLHSCGNGNRGKKQKKETVQKRSEAIVQRHKKDGLSEAEVLGHRKVSEKLKGRSVPGPQREQIRETLSGRKTGYNPVRCRTVSERLGCDTVYLLKVTSPSGTVFGKWGSTRNGDSRWRSLELMGMRVEVLLNIKVGKCAPEIEETIGRTLSNHPADLNQIVFGGYTETFEWSEQTQNIVKEIINGLEESSAS